MEVIATPLEGVLLLKPKVFGDHRGFFLESFRASAFQTASPCDFVQDNHSRSRRGILRGLHFQNPMAQGKLVRVSRGSVYDVAVDIRVGSPTFGKWYGCVLDDVDHAQLWIPPGLAHGFLVLSDEADFIYKCTEYYAPQHDAGIAWNDPDIGIDWPLDGIEPILSAKDLAAPRLNDFSRQALPVYAMLHANGSKGDGAATARPDGGA